MSSFNIEEAKKGSDVVPVSKPSAPSGGKQVPAKTTEPKLPAKTGSREVVPAKPSESKVPATKIKQPSAPTKGKPQAGKTLAKGASATTGLISLTTMDKEKTASEKDVPTPKRKPAAPAKEAKNIPVGRREGEAFKGLEAEPKARPTPQMRASMPSEKASSEKDSGNQDDWLKDYMATRMEMGQKAGGRVGKVKKYAKGGKIGRGCGAAMRGGGKVMR